jgi:hypothetical protein
MITRQPDSAAKQSVAVKLRVSNPNAAFCSEKRGLIKVKAERFAQSMEQRKD